MTSRERMLTAIGGGEPDYVPLSFMIFTALEARGADWFGQIEAQLELGLDPAADLSRLVPLAPTGHADACGMPLSLPPDVTVRQWREKPTGARYPVLHKHYETPDGTLSVAVNQTEDWPYGESVPLLDDFLVPRCTKHLVTCEEDLPALRRVLSGPLPQDVETCRHYWQKGKEFARRRDLLLVAGWGVGADALGWLCGLDKAVLSAVDRPEFLAALLDIIYEWNLRRMEPMLEVEPDLFVRRGWYEGTAYWSPGLFRQFLLPPIEKEVELAHQAGAAYAYIMTVGGLQFADLLLEAGIDVLVGVDPIQDRGMDMGALRSAVGEEMCLWGGVNGFITVERGGPEEIRQAARTAVETLGPAAFILSPVDNVRDTSEEVWQNVLALVAAWKEVR